MKQEKNIWEQSRVELFQKLDCRETGLSQEDAADRLAKYGANELHAGKQKSVLQIFLGQFADFLVLILILAAVISACMGDVESMIVILAVITMNAILGTVQTVKASASLDSLKQMSAPTAKVLRDGQIVQIPGREVVPGDVVILEAGDSVCADGRLLECASLKCAESALTGESLPVEKDTEPLSGETALGDRKNMVFSGSLVTYGRATVLVTGTGMDTELGKIAALMNQTQQRKTPLQQSLDSFSAKLAMVIMAICAVVFALSIFRTGMGILDSLMFAVALAVAAIPEALSSIVTIVLAMGTQKMARQNAIMKDLKAVESLGSVSVICSDKTGTLTQNKMTPQKIYADGLLLDGAEIAELICGESRRPAGMALRRADGGICLRLIPQRRENQSHKKTETKQEINPKAETEEEQDSPPPAGEAAAPFAPAAFAPAGFAPAAFAPAGSAPVGSVPEESSFPEGNGTGTAGEEAAETGETGAERETSGRFGPGGRVRLLRADHRRLVETYGESAVSSCVRRMDEWLRRSGQHYRDPLSTLEKWLQSDAEERAQAERERAPAAPAYLGKRTGAHNFSQREYTDAELEALLYTDLDELGKG